MDELELLAFHALDHGLVLDALLLLGEGLVLDLLLRAKLPLEEVALPLVLGLALLVLYHLLQLMVLYLLLMLLHLHEILLVALFLFEIVDVAADFVLVVAFGGIDICSDAVLELPIGLLAHGLLMLSLALALCPLGRDLHIALSRAEDVRCALLSFVKLFPCLSSVSYERIVPSVPLA